MTAFDYLQIVIYLSILLLLVKPFGAYMARVYEDQPCGLDKVGKPIERFIYRLCSINSSEDMTWKSYLSAMLIFNLIGFLVVYFIQRIQFYLPLNPENFRAVPSDISFNTAISFITNTNWQAYVGESTLSYCTKMLGLMVQNFLSAASGMAILVAFIRGLRRHESKGLGNYWVDITRTILYILLPLAFIFAIFLGSQGVIQNFKPYQKATVISQPAAEQIIPMGPAASQVAIKQLGTSGGGFFSANSAHPFENPTPLTNFLEMLAMLLIPTALCYTFGVLINDRRQGWAILAAMLILFVPFLLISSHAEISGNSLVNQLNQVMPAGNMEGKEVRFGVLNSALWSTAATATSTGSVNAMLDSFTPIGGMVSLWMMQLGEVVFGGVGTGLYQMLMLVLISVFVSGLLVGRTPEYLGKKIEPFEMKMASFAVLIMPLIVLIATAYASVKTAGSSAVGNPGTHGFTEILYAFTSMGANNGSAFSGLDAKTPFYTTLGGVVMLLTRFWIAIAVLAIAGSLVQKKILPKNPGTLPTHTFLFILILVSIVIVGTLSFVPALALGPITEQLTLWR